MTKGLYCRPTQSLVNLWKTKVYRVDIPVPHPQLRNFISTVDKDWIYFASQHDIYTLHLPSQRISLLITVPFTPRCLAAGLGWICVGGQDLGNCAFIKLNEEESEARFQVDSRLPINLSGTSRTNATEQSTHGEDAPPAATSPFGTNVGGTEPTFKWQPDLLVHELGGDIVNSITIHEISNQGVSDWNEPIAVLSNNDKTVKIYSLLQHKVIAELLHPIPMNYALISPDSETLAAVGDGSRAFFYRRKLAKKPPNGVSSTSSSRFPKYEWQLFDIPRLPVGDRMADDHSFSITFSPSGHLCALSSQGGMISVFDMDVLKGLSDDEESDRALLCMFKSSRTALWGCVRSMAFSPAPWDLLAWTEDHGRAGVADCRQAFCRRQIIELDMTADDLERIQLEDVTPPNIKGLDTKGRLIHQYREGIQSNFARSPHQTEYEMARNDLRASITLNARERSVLNTLDTTMDDIYAASMGPRHPYTLNYTSSPRVRASLESELATSTGTAEGLAPEFRGQMNEVLREQRERLRTYLPRRRSSVVLSHPNPSTQGLPATLAPRAMSRNRLTASPSRLSQAEDQDQDLPPLMSTNDLTPTAGNSQTQPLPYNIPPSDPWHVIQSALESARALDSTSNQSTNPANIARIEAALAIERRLSLTASPRPPTTSTSAQTSALPTTNLPRDVRQYMDEVRHQVRSQTTGTPPDFETERQQLRRSISRSAERDARDGSGASLPPADIARQQRILQAREQAREHARQRAALANAGRMSRTERRTELAGRVSDSDMRLARLMMMTGGRQMIDRNGNWVAGEALERLLGGAGGPGVDADGLGGAAARDLIREMGVGTTGVTWSPDGRNL